MTNRKNLYHGLERRLAAVLATRALPGLPTQARRESLLWQLVESVRRVAYWDVVRARGVSSVRCNPRSDVFDPFRAAIEHHARGDRDEACWLVFLGVHFGQHRRAGWRLARDVYGALGSSTWSWARVSAAPKRFTDWVDKNAGTLRGGDGVKRPFGNHRKYETLKGSGPRGLGTVVESYVAWVSQAGGHSTLLATGATSISPEVAFDSLYQSMAAVTSFGRTARFDYLNMLRKLGISGIAPGSPYLVGATGPLAGARLLFSANVRHKATTAALEPLVIRLARDLGVGMDVIEDALCNWQKSPDTFLRFRG